MYNGDGFDIGLSWKPTLCLCMNTDIKSAFEDLGVQLGWTDNKFQELKATLCRNCHVVQLASQQSVSRYKSQCDENLNMYLTL